MERFLEFAHLLVTLDVILVGVVFAAGIVIAPAVILVRRACWWRRGQKWAAVAALTSWISLWLFWRDEARSNERRQAGAAGRPT